MKLLRQELQMKEYQGGRNREPSGYLPIFNLFGNREVTEERQLCSGDVRCDVCVGVFYNSGFVTADRVITSQNSRSAPPARFSEVSNLFS